MTLRSASYSLKYTENTPITAVRKVCLSVSRHCLSRPIERGNPWKRATSISLVLVSETRTVLTISFLQPPKLKKWSIERGNPWERAVPVHRLGLRTLFDEQRQMIVAEYCEKIGRHELQAARAEQERQILQEELWLQQKDFREVHQQNLTEMEELRKFQSSTFDTLARQKLIEDQNTVMELSGRLQELQNEVNCINESKDFQDAESVRSGNSHVTNQPGLFPKHPVFEGMLRPSFVSPRRKEGPPDIWDTHGISGIVVANPQASSTVPYPQELNPPWRKTIEEPFHMSTAEKSERPERDQDLRCQSGPSAKDSVIFSGGDYSKKHGADQQQ